MAVKRGPQFGHEFRAELSRFGDRLREAIEQADTDGKSLALRCGFQHPHISRLLNKRSLPSYATAVAILNAMPSVDARWLLTGKAPNQDRSHERE